MGNRYGKNCDTLGGPISHSTVWPPQLGLPEKTNFVSKLGFERSLIDQSCERKRKYKQIVILSTTSKNTYMATLSCNTDTKIRQHLSHESAVTTSFLIITEAASFCV
jgi:hypothetical protein